MRLSTAVSARRDPVPSVAIVHDYLTQRGGAERVVLSMLKAFPGAPLYTSLYLPGATFPEFRDADVRTLGLNRFSLLRERHRLAFPFLASAFAALEVTADVVLCSSSGWAHGVRTSGRKLVYCHNPARWLYQTERYVRRGELHARALLGTLRPYLQRADRRAAASVDRYVTVSRAVRDRVLHAYGVESEIVPPPHAVDPGAPRAEVEGVERGFHLCVSRLLPYKNVEVVVEAFSKLPDERLVVVGKGPQEARLRAVAGPNVTVLGAVSDDELRWLYANATSLLAASYEDFGLTPLEAAAFGKPAAVLRFGGFLDTVVEGLTGVFFDQPTAGHVADAVDRLRRITWSGEALRRHAARYSEARFVERLREMVDTEAALGGASAELAAALAA